MNNGDRYDAIVIGSGIGGLTVAALLSKIGGKRVLVAERHFKPGGQTHSFVRKGKYSFDVGMHYLGQMGQGEDLRVVMDFITGGKVAWNPMPEQFERFIYPDLDFLLPNDPKKCEERLGKLFPAERKALRRYYRDIRKAAFWFGFRFAANAMRGSFRHFALAAYELFGGLARITTRDYLTARFTDTRLKGLLASQWADIGLPPAQSAFGMHAIIVNHYLRGGWYPTGGAGKIAENVIPEIERRGGVVRTGLTVARILVRDGAAIGIACRTDNEEELHFFAPLVISDAGAYNTYLKLLPPETALPFRSELESFPSGASAFVVYIGFRESPAKLGFNGANIWVFSSYDHDGAESGNSPESLADRYFLSFPSLKDPEARSHTAEVVFMTGYEEWMRWAGKGWRKRDGEYYDLKKKIAERLMDLMEKRFPGFQDLVSYYDVSTPLTMEYFQGNPKGAFYGTPCVPERLEAPWCSVMTPVRGLFLSGEDAMLPGIGGAMMGGVFAAAATGECGGFINIMGKIRKEAASQ